MSNVTRHAYAVGGEGSPSSPRSNRQGSAVVVDQYLQWALEGRLYIGSAGSETTPLTSVTYDQDQPEVTISIPSGTTFVPLLVVVNNAEAENGTDKEVILWRTTNAIGAGTSTVFTDVSNLRSDDKYASVATARYLHTANVTLTDYVELDRWANPVASIAPFDYRYEPKAPPVLVGPATLGIQISATTTQMLFFAKVVWAEFPTADIT